MYHCYKLIENAVKVGIDAHGNQLISMNLLEVYLPYKTRGEIMIGKSFANYQLTTEYAVELLSST